MKKIALFFLFAGLLAGGATAQQLKPVTKKTEKPVAKRSTPAKKKPVKQVKATSIYRSREEKK